MDDIKAFALKIFQSQPFSQFIGAELVTCSHDSAELALAVQDHHRQQH